MGIDILGVDLDGTLVDTAPAIAEAANRTLAAHGLPPRAPGQIADLIGHGARHLMLQLLAREYHERPALADTVRHDAVLERFEHEWLALVGASAPAYPGVREALQRLRDAGVRLACVSNKERRHAWRVLAAAGLADAFDVVIGGDTLPHRKPHGSVLRHVVERLRGDARRAAHVGDSSIDVEAARNAGVAAWAVPYGYNGGRPVAQARPDRIFDSLSAVADHVLVLRARCVEPRGVACAAPRGAP